jgi:hypothetical protein
MSGEIFHARIELVLSEYEMTNRKIENICRSRDISTNSYRKYLTDEQRVRHELAAARHREANKQLLKKKFGSHCD